MVFIAVPVFYIYVAVALYKEGTGTWTLLPSVYSTDAACRSACSSNIDCLQYGYFNWLGASACYTSTTLATLTTDGISAVNPGYIIAQKIDPITPSSNVVIAGFSKFMGLATDSFYTCFSSPSQDKITEDASSTCGVSFSTDAYDRAVDGSLCKKLIGYLQIIQSHVPPLSCSSATHTQTSCMTGAIIFSTNGYTVCGLCTGSGISRGGTNSVCTISCPPGSNCASGVVNSCSTGYGMYPATATIATTNCQFCRAKTYNWVNPTSPCTGCPNNAVCTSPGYYKSCIPGYSLIKTDTKSIGPPPICFSCSSASQSSYSLGALACTTCGDGALCASPTRSLVASCRAGYGYSSDGISPAYCTACSSVSPGTYSVGGSKDLPSCTSCGDGVICLNTVSKAVGNCLPGYVGLGILNTLYASCSPCLSGYFSPGNGVKCVACSTITDSKILGVAACDPASGKATYCLAGFGFDTVKQTCNPCLATTWAAISNVACISCPAKTSTFSSYCTADTGTPGCAQAGYSLSAGLCGFCSSGGPTSITWSDGFHCLPCGKDSFCGPSSMDATSCTGTLGVYPPVGTASGFCAPCVGEFTAPGPGAPCSCPTSKGAATCDSKSLVVSCIQTYGFLRATGVFPCLPCNLKANYYSNGKNPCAPCDMQSGQVLTCSPIDGTPQSWLDANSVNTYFRHFSKSGKPVDPNNKCL